MITMDIHPSVSSLARIATVSDTTTSSVVGVSASTSSQVLASKPIINTRETETVATIMEGETVIIAGLMQDSVNKLTSKTPLLGDVPFLGKLFRREVIDSQKTELIILITPVLVGPRAKDFGDARANYKMVKHQFPE